MTERDLLIRQIERTLWLSGRERRRLRRKLIREGRFIPRDKLPGIRHNIASDPSGFEGLR